MRKLILLGMGVLLSTVAAFAQEEPVPDKAVEESIEEPAEKVDEKLAEAAPEEWPETISNEDFIKSMKAVRKAYNELVKAIEAKDGDAADAAFKKLEKNATNVNRYGHADNDGNETRKQDAFKKPAKAFGENLAELRKQLKARDWEQADTAREKSYGNCKQCHDMYAA